MPAHQPHDAPKLRPAGRVVRWIGRACAPAALALGLLAAGLAAPALAQGPFTPRVTVNDRVITQWEIEQRAIFLQLFNTPGDLEQEAINRLIEERLQMIVAERFGVTATDEAVLEGMQEFAGRVELSVEEFLEIIGANGIEPESYESFIRAGVLWREVLRQRFAPEVNISEAEVDRALALTSQRGAVRILLSEIRLPLSGTDSALSRERARAFADLRGFDAFARAAREFSIADSAEDGGRLDWIPLTNLPPDLAGLLVQLNPGDITPPIPVQGGIALFQLRDVEELETIPPSAVSVRYARLRLPGLASGSAARELDDILARTDTCDDLYGQIRDATEEQIQIEERKLSEVPADIAVQLAQLDENEGNIALSQGDTLVYLMLCERVLASGGDLDREAVTEQLFNERIGALSAAYLEELQADAPIVRR
jgi:peptidyl-prolyl cis-trans isomerase SurA